jgi:hypothetical protein
MDLLQTTNAIVISVGIPAMIGCSVYIGKKLQILVQLKETSEKIKHNLKVVTDFLVQDTTTFNPVELRNYSPLQLTDAGMALIQELGFDNVFAAHKEEFLSCISQEEPKLKYDVEAAAIKSIFLLNEKPYMDFLKIYLYNNPNRSLDNLAPTLGVFIRDAFLAAHPEIKE